MNTKIIPRNLHRYLKTRNQVPQNSQLPNPLVAKISTLKVGTT